MDVKVALELNVARCAVKIGGGGDDGGGGGGGGFDKIAGEVLGLSSSTSGSGSACFEFLAGNTSDDDDDDDSESKISSLTGIAFVRVNSRERDKWI